MGLGSGDRVGVRVRVRWRQAATPEECEGIIAQVRPCHLIRVRV